MHFVNCLAAECCVFVIDIIAGMIAFNNSISAVSPQ